MKTPFSLEAVGAGVRAFNTQSYVESNVKLGSQFYIQATQPLLAAGASQKIAFTTGNLPVLIKGRDLYASANNLSYAVFRQPSGISGGTPVAIQNYNDINPIATTCSILAGVTATSNGTPWGDPQFIYGSNNAGARTGSGLAPSGDRVLKPNTTYLVVITNQDTAALTFAPSWFLTWFEGTPDLPLA